MAAFYGCSGLTGLLTIPDGVTSIGDQAFSGCSGLMGSLTIPNGVTSIGDHAFSGCSGLMGPLTIPDGVTYIGWGAFSGCSGLTGLLTIPNSVTSVENYAFSGCSGLMGPLTIPSGVTHIGYGAFRDCSSLTSVTIPDSVTGIDTGAFQGCSSLASMTIPQVVCSSTLRSVFPSAYQAITNVVVSDGVTSIGSSLFAGCTNLAHITIPASVMSIGDNAFKGCTSLQNIVLPGWFRGRIDEASVFADCASGLEILYDDTIGIFVNTPTMNITEADQCNWSGDGAVSHDGVASARLNGRGLDSTSSIELSVTGPGRLSFWWKASSEYDANADEVYDYGFLSIDGVAQGGIDGNYKLYGTAIGGNTDWTNVVAEINGAGTHTVVWTYYKDDYDELAGFADCIWLDEVVLLPFVSVEFAPGGGSGALPETVSGYSGELFTLPSGEGLSRAGFLFGGWSDGVDVFPAGSAYVLGDSGVTLTAYWLSTADESWRVTFDLGGGTGTPPAALAAFPGEVVRLPGADGFSRDSHVFTGWSDGTAIYATGAKYTIPVAGATFTAQWFRPTKLAFDLDGGVGIDDLLYVPGTTVRLPAAGVVSKAKHVFSGWDIGATPYEGGAEFTVPASDVVITAKWTAKTISLPAISSAQVDNGGEADASIVTVSISAEGVTTVHYTLDGSTPTSESPIYTAPLMFTDFAVTVKAIAVRDDYFDSDVAAFSFTRKPYTPVDCLGLYGVEGVTVTVGGDGESWYRVEGAAAHDGVAGLRAGTITHGQTNWVNMTVAGPGRLSFWWKASSEAIRGKPKDGLTFFADGERIGNMIGGTTLDWAQVSFDVVGDGLHVFRWAYSKDALDQAANIGEDCAWLDDVVWTPYGADPIPEIWMDEEVVSALSGTADVALVANVTNAVQYTAYRSWALSVTNATTTAQTIKESTRTWLSYAFATDALIDKELTSDDVKIESFTPASTDGKFEFTVSVKDVNIGGGPVTEAVLKENLKKVLGIEGAKSLSSGAFSSDNIEITFDTPVDGKAKFTVSPPADAGNSFFMRVKVK